MKTVIGIDFGTSTTVVAKRTEGSRFEPEIIEVDGNKTTDTVLRLSAHGSAIEAIGPDAWAAAEQYPDRTYYEFKPKLGKHSAFRLPDGKGISAEKLASHFLARVREAIESFYGNSELAPRDTITIIGYPPDWCKEQKTAVMEVAKAAGFPNVQGCAEPLGVLYFHHSRGDLDLSKPQKILVYDLGGGTTDTCLVEVSGKDELPRVIATSGKDIGGRHFDEALAKLVEMNLCKEESLQGLSQEDKVIVRKTGRLLKERFSDEMRYGRDHFKYTTPLLYTTGRGFKLRMTRQHFEGACAKQLQLLNEPLDILLQRSGLKAEQIHRVVIAGGMGRLYSVRSAVQSRFPHLKDKDITTSTNPQEVVAKGLVLYGLRKLGAPLEQSARNSSVSKSIERLAEQRKKVLLPTRRLPLIRRVLASLIFPAFVGISILGYRMYFQAATANDIPVAAPIAILSLPRAQFSADQVFRMKAVLQEEQSAMDHHFNGLGGRFPGEPQRTKKRWRAEDAYVKELEAIDLENCPQVFQDAFKAYREDRRSLRENLGKAWDGTPHWLRGAGEEVKKKFQQSVEQARATYQRLVGLPENR